MGTDFERVHEQTQVIASSATAVVAKLPEVQKGMRDIRLVA
jgi:hypothetical protein